MFSSLSSVPFACATVGLRITASFSLAAVSASFSAACVLATAFASSVGFSTFAVSKFSMPQLALFLGDVRVSPLTVV